jgi:hypothetical protein
MPLAATYLALPAYTANNRRTMIGGGTVAGEGKTTQQAYDDDGRFAWLS